jgi:anti-sigma factor RsiW
VKETMQTCETELLSAFVDGELEPAAMERIASHVATCAICQAEVNALRELSAAFASAPFDDLRPIERARLHQTLEEKADAPIWRIGGAMGLIAASILVVAGTWLVSIPSKAPRPGGPVIAANAEEWEQIASSLRVEVPGNEPQIDQWMLDQLALADGSRP